VLVAIRVDASSIIGTGHVMRCLTLAIKLRDRGVDVYFICRDLKGHMGNIVKEHGFPLHLLSSDSKDIIEPPYSSSTRLPEYTSWLSVSIYRDTQQTQHVLKEFKPDWLIVDHYALDKLWQLPLNQYFGQLFVIDDLANRAHNATILLDQTLDISMEAYNNLVPKSSNLLLGISFVLLREEFEQYREYSLRRRLNSHSKNLLIMMGGADNDNYTGKVLDTLKDYKSITDFNITLVLGASAVHCDKVTALIKELHFPVKLLTNINNIAQLLAETDIAIGAAGSSTWERCCLGVPTLQMILADNQTLICERINELGAALTTSLPDLIKNITLLLNTQGKMSLIASAIVSGAGTNLVVDQLLGLSKSSNAMCLSPALKNDGEFIYSLQTPESRKYSRTTTVPLFNEHVQWYKALLTSANSVLFIIYFNGEKTGFLRLDTINQINTEISIVVSNGYQGKGLASFAINSAKKLLPGRKLKATVHKDNVSSNTLFERLAFKLINTEDYFNQYIYSA